MQASGQSTAPARSARAPALGLTRLDLPTAATFVVPLVLIVWLALSDGGYGVVERSQAAVALWWLVLVGTGVGALPIAGDSRAGRLMFGLLALFAAWTALSLSWSESADRSSIELGRTSAYLGVFVLALAVQGRQRWRPLLGGITVALAAVCALAVLSRLEPNLFPARVTGTYLPGIEIERRLAYPLNYSSGLGALAAIALPLLLAATSWSRRIAVQSLAAAALPIAAVTIWLTTSTLSAPAALIGLAAYIALAPDRLPKLATLAVAGAGSAVLFAAVEQRNALDRGLPTPAALSQGDSMLALILVVCVGAGLLHAAIGLAVKHGRRPGWSVLSRRQTSIASAAVAVVLIAVALAAGAGSAASNAWDEFRGQGDGTGVAGQSRSAQFLDVSSSGRYQFWQAAADANASDRLKGIGPGTFEFWWSRNGSYGGFVRDAHSLYLETFGELGIVGLMLIGSFVLAVLGIGVARVLRAPPETRVGIAAATAGCLTFAAAAAVDWTWELGVLAVTFMALAAVVVNADRDEEKSRGRRGSSRSKGPRAGRGAIAGRIAIGLLSLAAIAAISAPLAAQRDISQSEQDVADGQLGPALSEAKSAVDIQPYAASAHLQASLVYERQGNLGSALAEVREATGDEKTNWRNWFVRSRLEAESGDAKAALTSFKRAKALNPSNYLFNTAGDQ